MRTFLDSLGSICDFDGDDERKAPAKIPKGHARIERPKHGRCAYYSYSNPMSQDALICETQGFPDSLNKATQAYASAYSDRLMVLGSEPFSATCQAAGGGPDNWGYCLPRLDDDKLREFAKVALGLSKLPLHVRAVHHFNVATCYSCPTVEAIYEK